MLKQRILTAIILIPLTLILLLFLPLYAFGFLTAAIVIAAAWEWSALMELKTIGWRVFYLVVVSLALVAILFVDVPIIFLCAFIWWLVALVLIVSYPFGSQWWQNKLVRGLMGLFVLVPSWAAINIVRSQNDGIYALLFLFVLIWGADSAAYFVGKRWGKNKLTRRISPGKTVEGLWGALIFSIIFALIAQCIYRVPMSIWPWGVALSLATVLFSVVGDLFESMLKRQAGVKDSSQLLPGHGGLLDRIDSLTAAAPTFVLGAILLGLYLE